MRVAFAVGGALIGSAIGPVLLYFLAGRACVDGVTESFCGLSFLGRIVQTHVAVSLAAMSGATVGAVFGFVVGSLVGRSAS
jgi:hypothetical protein